MNTILLVDDDALIVEIYRPKLQQAGFAVEVAEDGLAAMKSLSLVKPDLVVLDLMMPKLGGVDVLKFIRSQRDLKSTPVIIFSNAYMSDVVEAAATTGADKAVLKASCTPALLIEVVNQLLVGRPVSMDTSLLIATRAVSASEPPPPRPEEAEFRAKVRAEFLSNIPASRASVCQLCETFILCTDDNARPAHLLELFRKIHYLTSVATIGGCGQIARICSALEALLFELQEKPHHLNPSALQTIAASVELLGQLFDRAGSAPLETFPALVNVLVVDDDPLANHLAIAALRRVNIKAVSADRPSKALQKLLDTRFDLFLLDISMPEMDGFELCARLRALPEYNQTPIIFVSSHEDYETNLRSILSSGHDLIAKPILPIELAVKVVTHLLRADPTHP